ncbi:MAG: hypothetical protein A3G18_03695 [Rhodospirillales bacterium RIFCSPLOWO2_12_FULL_58_28]|nr:MAG: hypothetical protein A3H92_00925 [Rhodospirillales bacterium RIFCSPLOWO2_02_FULL_58_16]OHC76866.1 MAG: hypothetical protein A3G18_03695 [Rhodospirillales bacterium RIFCSPLOWO2_12_FULL_58_28]
MYSNRQRTFESGPFVLILAVSAALCAAYFVYVLFLYGNLEGYVDHIEPSIAISAWRFMKGHALFQDTHEWPKVGGYGPLLYIFHSVVFKIAGGSIPLSKLAGSIAAAGSILFFYFYARGRFGAFKAYAGVLMFIAVLMIYAPYSFWNRSDPFIVFFVTLAVFAKDLPIERWGRWTPYVVVGLCIGLATNLKIHSFIYFIPIVLDLCGWREVYKMVIIGLISIIVFLLPFIHPGISLTIYLHKFFGALAAKGGIDSNMLATSFRFSLYFLSPVLLLAGLVARGKNFVDGKDALYFAALVVTVAISIYPASIPGTGPHHFLPLLAITIDSMLRFAKKFDDAPRLQMGILALIPILFLVISLPVQRRLIRNIDRIAQEKTAKEIHEAAEKFKDEAIEIGYGESLENYRFSYFKPILLFAGNPITVSAKDVMEYNAAGFDYTDRFVAELEACKTRNWLIPKGEAPFRLQSYYGVHGLFGRAADVFTERYEKTDALSYYDLWSCKKN